MGRVARKYPQGRFFLRTPAKVDVEKLYPVYLCYFCDGKKIRQSTSIMVTKNDWNQDANHGIGELRASYGDDYKKKNQQLQKLLRKVDCSIFDYVEQNGEISPDIIQGFICGDDRSLRADKGQSFVTYANEMLEKQYQLQKIRVSTYKNSVSIINQFKKFMNSRESSGGCKMFVGNITEELVREFIAWVISRGSRNDYAEKNLQVLSKICCQASNEGLLPKTTSQDIANIKVVKSIDDNSHRSIKYLTDEEMTKLVGINKNLLNKRQIEVLDMYQFANLACGLRVSDVITLRWCDVDFEKRELDKIQVKTRGRNIIPLTDAALAILQKWQGRHKTFVFGLLPDDGFNLKDEEKLRIRRNSITSCINKALEKIVQLAQINKKVTFHSARHSFAMKALEQGLPISMISSLMGHSSSYVTEKIYTLYRREVKAEAVRAIWKEDTK